MKNLKILHSPVNVCNQPWYVSRLERDLGHDSDIIVNYAPSYGLKADVVISEAQKPTFKYILKRLYFVLLSLLRYDVFHYYFGRTLFTWDDYFGPRNWLWYWDLKLAKFFGKRVIMTLQGCDIRMAVFTETAYEHSACHEKKCPQYALCKNSYDKQRQWLKEKILPKCDHIYYLNPDLGNYLRSLNSSFLPYASVPVDHFKVSLPKTDGVIKILHAPSVPTLKGTPEIIEVIEKLKNKYIIELILIQNKSFEEAIKFYHEADLVIDQLNCGWYGAFAVEVMAMGKPVACYLREEDYKFLPDGFAKDIPIYNLDPKKLVVSLEKIILDRSNWPQKGRDSRAFVEKWHDPKKLQKQIFEKYLND